MADMLLYIGLVCTNAALLVWIIRSRSWLSFEGLGSALLVVVIGSDVVGLVISYALSPDSNEIALEFQSRLYPSLVHVVGLGSLAVGLAVANPRPTSLTHELTPSDRKRLAQVAWFLIGLGLGMKLLGMYAAGVRSLYQYVAQLYYYTVYQGAYGGFLDKGAPIAVLGLGLLAATRGPRLSRQVPIWAAMLAVSFLLTTSRADLVATLLVFAFTAAVFNRPLLESLVKPRWRLALVSVGLAFLLVVNAGIKSQIRFLSAQDDSDPGTVTFHQSLVWGVSRFADRFSRQGLYDGYANLVNRLADGEAPLFRGTVFTYSTTAWVPYIIYKNKPQHPFRDVGYLTYDDFRSSVEDVSATMLVGSAFADFGTPGVVVYLFLYGVILGVARRLASRRSSRILVIVWYVHLTLVDGASNMIHGGIVNLFDAVALASTVVVLAYIWLEGRATLRRAASIVMPRAFHTPVGETAS